ncbi:hypothetical protein AVEN_149548-1 [Araneus ventricosus]|uniref:Uncharacterized protein n=1 Tax=Araneus ventricosus TaxID=182803 RepID=A0A4Y2JVX7_ARAVE|nr:hypothetical protein AVEN_149548-1 [Araneus ventricosus]
MYRKHEKELIGILADHFSTESPNLLWHLSENRTNLFNQKGNNHWAIVKLSDANALPCGVMVSSSCTTIPILLAKLRIDAKVQVASLEPPPYIPDLVTNLGSKHLSRIRLSSESDMKTVVENWLNGQDVIFAKPGEASWSCVQINASIDLVMMRKSDRQVCLLII